MKKKVSIQDLDPKDLERLRLIAERTDRPVSTTFRRIIDRFCRTQHWDLKTVKPLRNRNSRT